MKPPLPTRLVDAWRVLRGIIDVQTIRDCYSRDVARLNAVINDNNRKLASQGNELSALRRDLDLAVQAKQRSLADADRHAREHINRADALNKVIEQFMTDCRLELRLRYERHMPPGNRFQPVTTYPKGTMLERRDSANRLIAVSHDGGETWASVETVVRVADVPRETPSNAHVNRGADSTLSSTPAAPTGTVTTPEAGTTAGAQ